MPSQFINEKTAYMYALHESDMTVYSKRQALLVSLELSSDEEKFYQQYFKWWKANSETCVAAPIKIENFWIYAYAKQSKQFHARLEKHYFHHKFRSSKTQENCLKRLFMQCYHVIESGYPKMYILEPESRSTENLDNNGRPA